MLFRSKSRAKPNPSKQMSHNPGNTRHQTKWLPEEYGPLIKPGYTLFEAGRNRQSIFTQPPTIDPPHYRKDGKFGGTKKNNSITPSEIQRRNKQIQKKIPHHIGAKIQKPKRKKSQNHRKQGKTHTPTPSRPPIPKSKPTYAQLWEPTQERINISFRVKCACHTDDIPRIYC